MAAISQAQGHLKSYSQSMSLPCFVGITKIDWEKSAKRWFFLFKMAAISQILEQLGQHFALHSETTQDHCMQNIIGICQNEGARSRTKIGAHILDPPSELSTWTNRKTVYNQGGKNSIFAQKKYPKFVLQNLKFANKVDSGNIQYTCMSLFSSYSHNFLTKVWVIYPLLI